MILCSEILMLISLSDELVSLSSGMTWQSSLKVNMNWSQEKIVGTRPTEADICLEYFPRKILIRLFFFLVHEGKEWNNY